jgi:hypothetical protein
LADVFYLYFTLRRGAIGDDLEMSATCPGCKHDFKVTANLSTLEVKTVDEPQAAEYSYKFRRPFIFRGKTITGCIMGPTLWSALEGVGAQGMNSGAAKLAIILGSLRQFDELGPVPFSGAEMTRVKMSKVDIEGLVAKINDSAIGPEMIVESTCPKCSKPFKYPIEWSSEDFFTSSSLPSQ